MQSGKASDKIVWERAIGGSLFFVVLILQGVLQEG